MTRRGEGGLASLHLALDRISELRSSSSLASKMCVCTSLSASSVLSSIMYSAKHSLDLRRSICYRGACDRGRVEVKQRSWRPEQSDHNSYSLMDGASEAPCLDALGTAAADSSNVRHWQFGRQGRVERVRMWVCLWTSGRGEKSETSMDLLTCCCSCFAYINWNWFSN